MEARHFKIKKVYLILFVAAVLIKFLLLALPGHYGDLFLHQKWGNFLINHPLTEIYQQTECNLPPFWVYLLWFFSKLHYWLTQQPLLIISEVLKIPGVLADIAIGLIIFYFLLKEGVKEKIAFGASLFFILNPFVVYNSSVWGQLDSTYTLFIFLTFVLFYKRKINLASIFLALSFLTKLQGVIFIPLFFFLMIKKYALKKIVVSGLIFLLTTFIILLPFIFQNISPAFIFQKTWLASWQQDKYVSLFSFNLWWLPQVIYFNRYIPDLELLSQQIKLIGPITLKVFGLMLFVLFYLLIFIHRKNNIFLLASLISFMFFMLPTAMHERYIFPFFAFFSVFWACQWPKGKKYLFIYGLISLICFLNLLFAIVNEMTELIRIPIYFASPALAFINTFLFFYLFFILIKKNNGQATNRLTGL